MIKINLLPPEYRIRDRGASQSAAYRAGFAACLLFALLSFYFYMEYRNLKSEFTVLSAQWAKIQPDSQNIDSLELEVQETLKAERDFLANFVTTSVPLTSLLIAISEHLPETAWILELQMERKGDGGNLFLKGLALPSPEHSSIEEIEPYLHQLKAQMPGGQLRLTTTRLTTEGTELTQFIANFEWKGSAP